MEQLCDTCLHHRTWHDHDQRCKAPLAGAVCQCAAFLYEDED